MSDHLDTNTKKVEIMESMDDIAIDFAYKAFKEAVKRSEDKELTEFELAPRTTRISKTISLIKNTPKSKSFTALISIPNERKPRSEGTGHNTIAKATTAAFVREREILTRIESGTEDVHSDLSWKVICAHLCRELDEKTLEAENAGVAKGKKRHDVKPQCGVHSSIIKRKLKDNKFLANKKITEVQYADFVDAFEVKEIHDHRGKATVQNLYKAIKLIFEFAQRKRMLSANQIPNIPKITWIQGEERPVIEENDLITIMDNFQNFYQSSRANFKTEENRRLFPFYIALTASCGLRPGEEVLGVKWSHLTKGKVEVKREIEEDGRLITKIEEIDAYYADITAGKLSNRTKDGGLKIVPFSRQIVVYSETAKAIEGLYFVKYGVSKSLSEIVIESKDDFMFRASGGRQINFADVLGQYMDYLAKKLSLRYSQYSLRHEFINAELNKGVKISDVAEQCGTSTKTIEGYYKKYRAMKRVARLLSNNDIEYFVKKTKQNLEST
jgi:integrase